MVRISSFQDHVSEQNSLGSADGDVMKNVLYFGASPCDEDCSQIGSSHYEIAAVDECRRWIRTLKHAYEKHHHEPLPSGLVLKVKSSDHDFGVYYEVIGTYDDNDEKAIEAAYWLDANAPTNWLNEVT